MILNIDYPPLSSSDTAKDISALRSWCVMLLDELNKTLGSINDNNIMDENERLMNWK